MMGLIEDDLRRYLWNEERFELRVLNESALTGKVAVGDCGRTKVVRGVDVVSNQQGNEECCD